MTHTHAHAHPALIHNTYTQDQQAAAKARAQLTLQRERSAQVQGRERERERERETSVLCGVPPNNELEFSSHGVGIHKDMSARMPPCSDGSSLSVQTTATGCDHSDSIIFYFRSCLKSVQRSIFLHVGSHWAMLRVTSSHLSTYSLHTKVTN